jgi:amino acid permease
LLAKDYLPGKPMSMFEIGFILFNRSSIFFISTIIIFNSLGLIIIYFIVFGDTLKSLIRDLSNETEHEFFGKRMAYVIILSVLLVPIILKKELKEIKILSVLLFTTLFGFVVLIIVQMSRLGI